MPRPSDPAITWGRTVVSPRSLPSLAPACACLSEVTSPGEACWHCPGQVKVSGLPAPSPGAPPAVSCPSSLERFPVFKTASLRHCLQTFLPVSLPWEGPGGPARPHPLPPRHSLAPSSPLRLAEEVPGHHHVIMLAAGCLPALRPGCSFSASSPAGRPPGCPPSLLCMAPRRLLVALTAASVRSLDDISGQVLTSRRTHSPTC